MSSNLLNELEAEQPVASSSSFSPQSNKDSQHLHQRRLRFSRHQPSPPPTYNNNNDSSSTITSASRSESTSAATNENRRRKSHATKPHHHPKLPTTTTDNSLSSTSNAQPSSSNGHRQLPSNFNTRTHKNSNMLNAQQHFNPQSPSFFPDSNLASSSETKTQHRERPYRQHQSQNLNRSQNTHSKSYPLKHHNQPPHHQGSRSRQQSTRSQLPCPSVADEDLMTKLSEELQKFKYDCMICTEAVKPRDYTFSCQICYAVFHQMCVSVWAQKSATVDGSWRCPGCQSVQTEKPLYYCFCRKTLNPQYNPYLVPHSCGQSCLKERNCSHRCDLMCHPGPCPPCNAHASPIQCHCGKVSFTVKCSELGTFNKSCGNICGRLLGCQKHTCQLTCHSECQPCEIKELIPCHCGKESKFVACGIALEPYSCKADCGYQFECRVHRCKEPCHSLVNHLELCPFNPAVVAKCPCGASTIDSLTNNKGRMSCIEPIPTCTGVCGKSLDCGHLCIKKCHTGECTCQKFIDVSCRCGSVVKRIACGAAQRTQNGAIIPPLCDKICNKFKSCRKKDHRCRNTCCDMEIDLHICYALCNKLLKCKQHHCQMECGHVGACMDCIEGVSFEELRCTCGRTVLYPPIACNAKLPLCNFPCRISPTCGHPINPHDCHSPEQLCPPCPYFTARTCACGQNTVKNIPCSRQVVPSCGKPCSRVIERCQHKCLRFCHSDECVDDTHRCMAKCGRKRMICNHECTQTCHGTKYCLEDKPCQGIVTQTCECGNKTSQLLCRAWAESQGSQTMTLACDDECQVIKRNKLLAEALGVTPKGEAAFASISAAATSFMMQPSIRASSKSSSSMSDDYNGIEISGIMFGLSSRELEVALRGFFTLDTNITVTMYDEGVRAIALISSPSLSAEELSSKLQDIEGSISERILDSHLGTKVKLLKGVDGWKSVSKKKAIRAKEAFKGVESSSELVSVESQETLTDKTVLAESLPVADSWEDVIEQPR